MLESVLSVVFSNAAGELVEHPAGYGLIRYRAGKRSEGDIAAMLTQAGALLLRRGWTALLSDNRQMAPLTEAEKAWVVAHWQGRQIARPAHVRVAIPAPRCICAPGRGAGAGGRAAGQYSVQEFWRCRRGARVSGRLRIGLAFLEGNKEAPAAHAAGASLFPRITELASSR